MFHPEYLNYGALAVLAIGGVAVSPLRNRFRVRPAHREWVRPERLKPRVRMHSQPRYEREFDPIEREPEVQMQPPQSPQPPPRHEPPKPHEPPKHEPPKKEDPHKPKPGPGGQKPRDESTEEPPDQPVPAAATGQLIIETTNYSIAPGMAWFEMKQLSTINVFSGSPTEVRVALNPRGSASLLKQGLILPVAIVAIPPTDISTMFRHVDQGLPQPSYSQVYRYGPGPNDWGGGESPYWNYSVPFGPAWTNVQQMVSKLWLPAPLIAGARPTDPRLTGMSPQGFPGQPRQLMPAGPDPVMSENIGVNRAYVDTTLTPAELVLIFVAYMTDSIPTGTRWLATTITGV